MPHYQSDAFVFFGATGDLAHKQIFPALLGLVRNEGFDLPVIGVAKAGWTLEQFRARAMDSLKLHGAANSAASKKLLQLLRYVDGDYQNFETFTELRKQIGERQKPLHYLAIPPGVFGMVVEGLAKPGGAKQARVVVEKPFGRDLASARALNNMLHRHFDEKDIYRIDHYLGKEPVQNILYTRFANPVFEPIWNRTYIRSIQITLAERFGIGTRGHFYDAVGALRDVVQNHMLQVLANLTMNPPGGEDHEALRDQRADLLKAMRPVTSDAIVRGQYQGYRTEEGVAPDSETETFVAVKLLIDSWRWAGVPIFLRTGKEMPVTATEVYVTFRRPPRETFGEVVPAPSAHMRMRISPEIAIGLGVRVKAAGERMVGSDVELELTREEADARPPYERLLGDALRGQGELFSRADLVEAQWRVVEPVLGDVAPVYTYKKGSWGPDEVNQLIGADGPWINPGEGHPHARGKSSSVT